MARFRCYRCPDQRAGLIGRFKEFEADVPKCPHCGAGEPAVVELADVHFLVPDPAGPFEGRDGVRRAIGCDKRRDVLAQHMQDEFSASDLPTATTCPSCKGLPEWKKAATLFRELRALLARGLA